MDVRSLFKVMVTGSIGPVFDRRRLADLPHSWRRPTVPTRLRSPTSNSKSLALALMRGQQRGEFEEKMEMNLALVLQGSRPVPRQRVSVRRVMWGWFSATSKPEIMTVEQLELPPDHQRYRDDQTRTGAGRGGDRLREIDDVGRHDRSSQHRPSGHIISVEDPIEFVHHHKKSIVTQREVGFDTLLFRECAEEHATPSSGRYSDRRSPRYGDHGSRDYLCRDRPSLSRHPALKQRESSDRTYHELLSRRTTCTDLSAAVLESARDHFTTPDPFGRRTRVPALEIMLDTPRIKDLIKKSEIDTLKEAMEQGIDEGCQTFDHVLFQLYKAAGSASSRP